jgi:hypothetical protein
MHSMPKSKAFAATFAALRGILEPHAKTMIVTVDKPGAYELCSREMTDRIGRPLFVAAVQMRKSYVTFHLMPVYALPELTRGLSPLLRKRRQGKSCFNFTTIEPAQIKELASLTKTGIARFKNIELPWARNDPDDKA